MNKPPEKLRVFIDKKGNPWIFAKDMILEQLNSEYSGNHFLMPWREFYYTLEKPMTQKTENLTTEEAWAAMARGEYLNTVREVFHLLNGRVLRYWDGNFWVNTSVLIEGPYSIVSDPSKPKEVEDEYIGDRMHLLDGNHYRSETGSLKALLVFIEKHFQRKP